MKKIYDPRTIEKMLSCCPLASTLRKMEVPLFMIEYASGESISNHSYFQVVACGSLSVSFIRDDGSTYSLSAGGENYIIGELDLFTNEESRVIAEATSKLTTIAVDAAAYREKLMASNVFLQLAAATMATKLISIADSDAEPSSLPERILNYMEYKCENHILYGIEKTAFRLHCSPRQLQRILNRFETNGLVVKIGKGKYKLTD